MRPQGVLLHEADVDIRNLERLAAAGDEHAAHKLKRARERAGIKNPMLAVYRRAVDIVSDAADDLRNALDDGHFVGDEDIEAWGVLDALDSVMDWWMKRDRRLPLHLMQDPYYDLSKHPNIKQYLRDFSRAAEAMTFSSDEVAATVGYLGEELGKLVSQMEKAAKVRIPRQRKGPPPRRRGGRSHRRRIIRRESRLSEADARLRSLERDAMVGGPHEWERFARAGIRAGAWGVLDRAGIDKETYDFWTKELERNPRDNHIRALWLNAAQREDEPAYTISTHAEETWYDYQYFVQLTAREAHGDDPLPEYDPEPLGPFGSEHEADREAREWVRGEEHDTGIEYDYDIEDHTPDEPERDVDEIVDDEEATLEDVLYELAQRGMSGEGDDGRWYSEESVTDYRTGRETNYYVQIEYLIQGRPHSMLKADAKRIADAIRRRVTDAERVPPLNPEKVR